MPTHGKRSTYNRGCRCDDCKAASAEGHQRYVAQGMRPLPEPEAPRYEPVPVRELEDAMTGDRWRIHAACRGKTAQMFPEHGTQPTVINQAKAICHTCPVRVACLNYALEHNETFGIWGGLSGRERREYKKQRRAAS